MTPADVVRAHYDNFNRADFEAWAQLLTPDFRLHHATSGEVEGRDAYLDGVRFYFTSFPDCRVELGRILEDGDLAAAELTSRATFAADFLGVPATGERWELPAMGFFRVEGDQLAEVWFVEDATRWFQGLAG